MEGIIVYTDGGARGNPGPAAIGVYIIDQDGKQVIKFGKKIGETTNNVAEYKAVYNALDWIKNNLKNNIRNINFLLDSKLVVNQLNGIFKIKNKNLGRLIMDIHLLEKEIGVKIFYNYIPREKNFLADSLVNSSLDK